MKGLLRRHLSYCTKERRSCVAWVEKYFKDCLCNLRDELSFGFGFVSLVCWGVAEIPQIVTNFRAKSSHGVSLAFLLTWVAGDVFNLVGCLLEPATLPTQYYTALLYTISTIILVFQSIYYDRIYVWLTRQDNKNSNHEVEEEKVPLTSRSSGTAMPVPSAPVRAFPHRDYYYTSARSLAGSSTPPFRSYLKAPRSGPSALQGLDGGSSSDEDDSAPVSSRNDNSRSLPRPIPLPRSAGHGAFLATAASLPFQAKSFIDAHVGFRGRKLLLHEAGSEHSAFGQWLGWLMAAIYMGGRIPQIFLNIKRGSVEGLNPLMFIFALVANVTYVASILVRTIEWDNIKANLPWLLDAGVCVLLDLFIIMQYIYYKCTQNRTAESEADHGDYAEANKAVIS